MAIRFKSVKILTKIACGARTRNSYLLFCANNMCGPIQTYISFATLLPLRRGSNGFHGFCCSDWHFLRCLLGAVISFLVVAIAPSSQLVAINDAVF